MDSNGIHLIRIHIMTHPPLIRMHQLIGLNDGDFKVTCDAIIFGTLYCDFGCERLGLKESLQLVVVAVVTWNYW